MAVRSSRASCGWFVSGRLLYSFPGEEKEGRRGSRLWGVVLLVGFLPALQLSWGFPLIPGTGESRVPGLTQPTGKRQEEALFVNMAPRCSLQAPSSAVLGELHPLCKTTSQLACLPCRPDSGVSAASACTLIFKSGVRPFSPSSHSHQEGIRRHPPGKQAPAEAPTNCGPESPLHTPFQSPEPE